MKNKLLNLQKRAIGKKDELRNGSEKPVNTIEYFKTRITFRCRGHVMWTHVRFYTMTHVFDFPASYYYMSVIFLSLFLLLLYIYFKLCVVE